MPSAEGAPVSDAEAAELFAPLRDRAGVALAVSGGPDSSALLILYARAARVDPRLPQAFVLTVDHRLRPEAAAEARAVAALAARHGLPHRTLVRQGDKPAANLQAEARRARYDLLFDAARDLGLDAVVTAHHAEDQAETFLARLARGSGVVGLAAMARARTIDGLMLFRPFLDLAKARLAATLVDAGEGWIEDPSNRDSRFDRVRLRDAAPLLADLGLTRDRLTATARAMARAAAAIEGEVEAAIRDFVVVHDGGWATVVPARFAALPEEVRLRLLSRLTRAIGGADYGPRLEALEDLAAAFSGGDGRATIAARTLAGVRVEQRAGRIFLSAERGRGAPPSLALTPGEQGRWRGRRVGLAADAPAAVAIAPLGAAGRRRVFEVGGMPPDVLGMPPASAAVVESAPAVFVDGELVACPALGWEAPAGIGWGKLVRIAPIRP